MGLLLLLEPITTFTSQETGATIRLRPIVPANLKLDTAADFDIYLQIKGAPSPILYRSKFIPLTFAAWERLSAFDVEDVFINIKDEHEYFRHIEQNLRDILANPQLDTPVKSKAMYSAAENMIRDALTDPRASDVMHRTGELVQSTSKFLLTNSAAFTHLLKVASIDYSIYTHSVNVFVFGVSLAQRVGLCADEATLHDFGLGLFLQDIGKSRIDPSILNFRGALNLTQMELVRQHTLFGEEVLRDLGVNTELPLDVVRHHHERLDGSGYPDGLIGEQVSPFVRVAAIADVFDALTTRRSFKKELDTFAALRLMKNELSDQLDQAYFRDFISLMAGPKK